MSSMDQITIHTDGSSRPKTKKTAGWSAVFELKGKIHVFYGHHPAPATNNIGEMSAVLYMMDIFRTANIKFDFVTDSEYVVKGIYEYREGWEKRGMRNNQGKPIANRERWVELLAAHDKRLGTSQECTYRWVRGHSGDIMNEIADFWANRGADDEGVSQVINNHSLHDKFWREMARYGHVGSGMPGDVIKKVERQMKGMYKYIDTYLKPSSEGE